MPFVHETTYKQNQFGRQIANGKIKPKKFEWKIHRDQLKKKEEEKRNVHIYIYIQETQQATSTQHFQYKQASEPQTR